MTTITTKYDIGQEVYAAMRSGKPRKFTIAAVCGRVESPASKGVEFTTPRIIYIEGPPIAYFHDERDVFLTEEEAKAHKR